ncbi:LCP family protein [Enterococcus lemanii]|uniref:LCP family protein n=1 Tax=Enterococcus lemanii TaxID=1159752 RepID=A0ABV9MTK6_9ENTE|nr:LCP family protein [Enterococcus lemanii]MBM7709069.1 LCP family protein required for cell wall assembly [Enterococcus lemanii]
MTRKQKFYIYALSFLVILVTVISIGVARFYLDIRNYTNETHKSVVEERKETGVSRVSEIDFVDRTPFSVLLLGIDTGGEGRTEQGRSDTLMLATINPNTEQTVLTSIPRDSYTEIVGYYENDYDHFYDKINHAYAYGSVAMAMDTVEKLLDVPIDYYVAIDFKGMEDLIDALGGVEAYNDFSFVEKDIEFKQGLVKFDGHGALTYARMRDQDPEGDYGRQKRQRNIVEAIAKKGLRLESVTQYSKVLKAVSDNLLTDLCFDEIELIALKYQDAFKNIKMQQLQGIDDMINDISYQIIPEQELLRVQESIKEQLEIPFERKGNSDEIDNGIDSLNENSFSFEQQ